MPEPLRSFLVHAGGGFAAALVVALALTGLFWVNGLLFWFIARLLRGRHTTAIGRALTLRPALLSFLVVFALYLICGASSDPFVGAVGAGGTVLGIALVCVLIIIALGLGLLKAWQSLRVTR